MQKYLALELFTEEQDDTIFNDVLVYLASDVDARIAAYEAALKEAEAIMGGECALHYGPFFELVQKARSL